MLIFVIYLPLKEPLVVTFGEKREHTSRKCVVVQGTNLTKSSKKHKLFWLHSSFNSTLKNSTLKNFDVFLPREEFPVASFCKSRAFIPRRFIVEQSIRVSN